MYKYILEIPVIEILQKKCDFSSKGASLHIPCEARGCVMHVGNMVFIMTAARITVECSLALPYRWYIKARL